ncbi:MAG: XRE family transcriptional regulator [Clostridia bacterium]|nr:XRE family transcriptional regulator [Clostridia bacterium]
MVTLSQRITELRDERGMSRSGLSDALGFPKNAIEKFETGRQTPTKEQQDAIAAYFGVSVIYLRGESTDRTRQDSWMDDSPITLGDGIPFTPAPAPKRPKLEIAAGEGSALLDPLLMSKSVQDTLRAVVLDTLRSPEGQEIIAKAVRKALAK